MDGKELHALHPRGCIDNLKGGFEWANFPLSKADKEALFKRLNIREGIDEYIASCWECDEIKNPNDFFGEFGGVEWFNEVIRRVDQLAEVYGDEAIFAAIDAGTSLEDMENALDIELYPDVNTEHALGVYAVEHGWQGEIPEYIYSYLDFAKIGRDTVINDDITFTKYGAVRVAI